MSLSGAWLLPKALRVEQKPAELSEGWLPWDASEVQRYRSLGKPVFVDFTADWCWTCKVNENAVLKRDEVRQALASQSAILMKADWTRRDPLISAALQGFGRSGVPLYVYYPAGKEPVVLPEVITTGIVLKALNGS